MYIPYPTEITLTQITNCMQHSSYRWDGLNFEITPIH